MDTSQIPPPYDPSRPGDYTVASPYPAPPPFDPSKPDFYEVVKPPPTEQEILARPALPAWPPPSAQPTEQEILSRPALPAWPPPSASLPLRAQPSPTQPDPEQEKKGFWSHLTAPLLNIGQALPFATELKMMAELDQQRRGVPINPDEPTGLNTAAKIGAGIQKPIEDTANFFTSKAGALTLGIGALPKLVQSVIAAGFTYTLAKNTPELARNLSTAIESKDPQAIAQASTEALLNTYFAYKAGRHAYESAKPAPGPTEGNFQYAGQEQPTDSTLLWKGGMPPGAEPIDVGGTARPQPSNELTFNPDDPGQQRVILQKALEKALGLPEATKQLPAPTEPQPFTQPAATESVPVVSGPLPEVSARPGASQPEKGPISVPPETGQPADEYGAIYGPRLSPEAVSHFEEQVGYVLELPSPAHDTRVVLKVKPHMLWIEASRKVGGGPGATVEDVGVAYMKIRANGQTVLNGSYHGRAIDRVARQALVDFLETYRASHPVTPPPEGHPITTMVESGEAKPIAASIASRYTIPAMSTDELANDAITHLYFQADKYPGDVPARNWAATVMRNYITDQARGVRPTESLDVVPTEGKALTETLPAQQETPAESAQTSEVMDAFSKAKAGLEPTERAILDATGESQSNVARTLGISQQAVSQRLPGIRRKLAAAMRQNGVDPADYLAVADGLEQAELPGIRPRINPRAGESGAVNVSFLQPLARLLQPLVDAGVSMARAAAQMARMFGSKVLKWVRQAWDTVDPYNPTGIARLTQKWFTSRGLTPPEVLPLQSRYRGALAEWNKSIAMTARDIERAGTPGDLQQIDDFMRGKARLDTLPVKLRTPIATARAQIDHLSGEIINSGLLKNGDVIDAYLRGLGKYLNRSYQIHTDRDWMKNVPPERVADAVDFVKRQSVAAGQPMTDAEAVGTINELLRTPHSDRVFLSNGTIEGSKNLGILAKRKVIPDVIRRLYGENKDPITNYTVTAGKQAQLVESQRFLHGVRQSGLGKFLFERPTGDYATRIAAETTPELAPLNGLYTTQDIYDALKLERVGDPRNAGEKALAVYRKLNSFVNWNLTVGSVKGQVRNIIANPLISIANGNFRLWKVPHTLRAMAADLGWTSSAAAKADLLKMYKLDLLGAGAIGENRARLRAAGQRITDTPSEDFFKRTLGQRILLSPIKLLAEMWKQGDDVFRIYDFKNEVAKMRGAQPNRPLVDIEAEAAEIVRNTRPTYDRVPRIVKAAKDLPFMGTFISWPSEIIRTSTNTFLQGLKEISSPDRKGVGVGRLMGLIAALSTVSVLSYYSAKRLGVSQQQEQDRKRYGPEWEKNSDLIFLKSQDGKMTTADSSFIDIYKPWKEAAMALAQGGDATDKIADTLKAFLKPYVSESVLTSTVIDLDRNRTPEGKPIWIDGDTTAQKWKSAINYALGKAALPGTVKDAMRLYFAETGNADFMTNPKGRTYDKAAERLSLTGIRARTQDIDQGVLYKAAAFKEKLDGVEHIFENRLLANGTVQPAALESAWTRMIRQRELAYREMIDDVQAAERLGVDEDAIITKLKAVRLEPREVRGILDGQVPPYRASRTILGAAEEKEPWRIDLALKLIDAQP